MTTETSDRPHCILLTGANGLLGQKLVALLARQPGVHLVATARGPARLPTLLLRSGAEVEPRSVSGAEPQSGETYDYHDLDVTDAAAVEACLAAVRPHAVIHAAAMTNVDQCETQRAECWQLNVEATAHLAATCARHDAFLLHLSTDFIFDGQHGPYDEEATPAPLSYYGESKLAAERAVQATPGLRWAIARTVLVYGLAHDMSRSNIILWVKKSLEAGQTIRVVTDQWRTPTLAEDLATGCWLIADRAATGIFNIAGQDLLTPYDMAVQTAHHFGLDASLIQPADSSTFSQPARRPPRTGFVLDKARRALGYAPHSFAEGIALLASQLEAVS